MEKFADIAAAMGEIVDNMPLREAAVLAVEAVSALIADCDVQTSLEDLGIKEEDFVELAKIALTVARPLANNPRPVTLEDAVRIYEDAF